MKIDDKFVKACLELSDNEHSKVGEHEKRLFGMSSLRQRCLLNNLCSLPDSKYLEIGAYKGASLIAAVYRNKLKNAYAVENYSYDEREPQKRAPKGFIWDNMKSQLADNISRYANSDSGINTKSIEVIEEDWLKVDWSKYADIDVCFFDITPLSTNSYNQFFELVYPALSKQSVVVFSSYSDEQHSQDLDEAILKNKDKFYTTSSNQRISGSLSDSTQYHSGILILTLQKKVTNEK